MRPLTAHPPSEATFGLTLIVLLAQKGKLISTALHIKLQRYRIHTQYSTESVTGTLIAEGIRVFPKRASLHLSALYLQPEDAPSCCRRANESNPFFKVTQIFKECRVGMFCTGSEPGQ